jgi:hypothetical protein
MSGSNSNESAGDININIGVTIKERREIRNVI